MTVRRKAKKLISRIDCPIIAGSWDRVRLRQRVSRKKRERNPFWSTAAGYRQTENVWAVAEPGNNVVLTIDLKVQQKAERALQIFGPNTRGALVVMDVETGDILAMASSPR